MYSIKTNVFTKTQCTTMNIFSVQNINILILYENQEKQKWWKNDQYKKLLAYRRTIGVGH